MRGKFAVWLATGSLLLALTMNWMVAPGAARRDAPTARRGSRADARSLPLATPTPVPQPTNDGTETAPDDEVVRVETNLTNVLLTAVDKDKKYVTALRAEDVRLYEDDKLQTLFAFQRETDLPLSIALLVDVSLSQEATLPEEKRAAAAFIASVLRPASDNFAVVSFTNHARPATPLTDDQTTLTTGLEGLQIVAPPPTPDDFDANGNRKKDLPDYDCNLDATPCTAIWQSVTETVGNLLAQTPERTRRAVILLSDGDETVNIVKVEDAAEFAVKNNTVIYAIGIGDRKNNVIVKGGLKKLAERTGGRAFFPASATDLQDAFAQIQAELRSQYLLAYTPTNAGNNGTYRRIRVEIINPEVKKQKLKLFYRQGYYGRMR